MLHTDWWRNTRRSSRRTGGLAPLQKTSNVCVAQGQSTSSTCPPLYDWSAAMADAARASKSKNHPLLSSCSNTITLFRFMHSECFEVWEDNILAFTSKLKDGGKRGKQQWSDKMKVSVKNAILEITLSFFTSGRATCGSNLPTILQWKYVAAVAAR